MKILTLEVENFLAIGSSGLLKMDDQGLVLIQGVNKDDTSASSNGVGKSTIPDALSWVNFGETAREVSGDAVVNEKAKKNCFVRETVQSGENVYMIERYRKHAVYKNQTRVMVGNDDRTIWTDISKGTEKETQALIEQILGCSKDVFMAAIYAGQESAPDLPGMTDKQLKLLIEEAAGVQKIEVALQLARKREATNSANLAAAEVKHAGAATRLEDFTARHTRAVTLQAEFEGTRADRKKAHLAEARKHLDQGSTYQKVLGAKRDVSVINDELAGCDAQLRDHKTLTAAAVLEQTKLNDLTRAADRLKSEAQRATETVRKTIAAVGNAAEEMKKPCGECGKPHTEAELEEFTAHLKTRQSREVEEAKAAAARWAGTKAGIEAQQVAVKAAEAAIPDVMEVTAVRSSLATELAEIERYQRAIDACKNAARAEMEHAKRVETEANPHDGDVELTAGRIVGLKGEIDALKKELAQLEKRAVVHAHAVKVFGPAGVRAHILDTVTPFLNAQTADYLSALSDGNITATWSTLAETAKGELREKFNIEVTNSKGAKTFKGLSGGEKRKVRLSTMLALQDLVATRASNPIQLWIGDEIDDALDKNGLERLMGVLEGKAREKGTVLIISHNNLSDWADRVAVVTKESGLSTIAGALS
jgi:DNA repair exonuclease SbcCD ATPase subunit